MSRTCPEARPAIRSQRGAALILALVVLAVLAVLATAMATLTQRHQLGGLAEVESAQALQAARGGLEWAAYQVLRDPPPPAAAPACFAAANMALASYTVSVSCTRLPDTGTVADGGDALVFYRLVAVACNVPTSSSCPASGNVPARYVERQLEWTVVR
jgi:MSHA biogenesis protein MshP